MSPQPMPPQSMTDAQLSVGDQQVARDQISVHQPMGHRLVNDLARLCGEATDSADVDQRSGVPLRVVEPERESIEQRFERTASLARPAHRGVDPDRRRDRHDGLAELDGESLERAAGQLVASRPSVGAVDPLEHRPTMGEDLARRADVAHLRGLHARADPDRLQLTQRRRLAFDTCGCVRSPGQSHDNVGTDSASHAPHGVIGARRRQVLDRPPSPLGTLVRQQCVHDGRARVRLVIVYRFRHRPRDRRASSSGRGASFDRRRAHARVLVR